MLQNLITDKKSLHISNKILFRKKVFIIRDKFFRVSNLFI